MLLQFKVANFRSIGEEQTLSLMPAENQKDYPENILEQGNYRSANVLSIYGANGSGKSNLIKALRRCVVMVSKSSKGASSDKLDYEPFLLRETWDGKPTSFELVFVINELRYRYGFSYNRDEILTEYLFRKNLSREVIVFQRKKDIIDTTSALSANNKLVDAAVEATRDNGFFLAAMDSLNIAEANLIFRFIKLLIVIDGCETSLLSGIEELWKLKSVTDLVNMQFNRLSLGPVGVKATVDEDRDRSGAYKILAEHIYYDKDGNNSGKTVEWDFMKMESSGTIKALEYAGPIMAALTVGGILVVDEIEANMHPLLTLDTIKLFLDKKTNPNGAQLIFTTHDTNLLSYSKLRRDQIYFTEKNKWASTEIYSLSDFVYVNQDGSKAGKERPDTDKEKRYIEGRYGAIPVFGRLDYQHIEENLNRDNG